MKILLNNIKAIVTCNKTNDVLYNHDILIEDQKIVLIEKNIPVKDDYHCISMKGGFVYPGLVNTHHHFFQTFVRNLITVDYPNITVIEWLDKIYEIFKLINEEVIYYSSLTACADLIKHGCTTAFDHQYCFPRSASPFLVDKQFEAAKKIGIRLSVGRGTNTLPKSEGSTIPLEMLEDTDDFLNDCSRLIDKYHDSSLFSKSQVVIAPCQPINCYLETFRDSVSLAHKKQVRLHTHLGEGENEGMLKKYKKRTLDYCKDLGFIGDKVWFAHGWELTNDESLLMAETNTGLSHCIGPAALGGFPILDLKKLNNIGLNVSLGVDGSSTNDSSNLLDTIRSTFLFQAWHSKKRGGCISPYEILKMATINGAKTLGMEKIGSLEVGKSADLFMISADKLERTGALHDPKNIIGRVGVTGPVEMTMVGGKIVYSEGTLKGIDEEKLVKEGEDVCNRFIREKTQYFNLFLRK